MSFFRKLFGGKNEKADTQNKEIQHESTERQHPSGDYQPLVDHTNPIVDPREKLKDFEQMKHLIFPYFKQFHPTNNEPALPLPDKLSEIDSSKAYSFKDVDILVKHVAADLYHLYALDMDYGFELVQKSFLQDWNVSEDDLHAIALENLRKLAGEKMQAHDMGGAVMLTINGNFEASAILMDEVWPQLRQMVGDDLAVCIPARDVIVATGVSNTDMLNKLSERARSVYESASHPVSKNWFLVKDGVWEVLYPIYM